MSYTFYIGLKGKRETIVPYPKEVTNLVQSTEDHGALDHTLANGIPIATSLRNNTSSDLEVSTCSFTVENKFAPSQKNEKQLKFTKRKTPGRKKIAVCFEVCIENCVKRIDNILSVNSCSYNLRI